MQENKFINKNLYLKCLIRNKDKKINVVDTNGQYLNVCDNTNLSVGQSANYTNFEFKNTKFSTYRFRFILTYSLVKNYSYTINILNRLKLFRFNKNKGGLIGLRILRPVRGGFRCYVIGIRGFLPKSHFRRLIKDFKQRIGKTSLSNVLYFGGMHSISEVVKFRLRGVILGRRQIKAKFNYIKINGRFVKNKNKKIKNGFNKNVFLSKIRYGITEKRKKERKEQLKKKSAQTRKR